MLRRGLPYSVLVHSVGLILLVFYGNRVATNPVPPPRSIRVQMVQLPQPTPPAAAVVAEPTPPVEQPKVRPESPPKELPKPKPDPKPEPQKPQPEVKVQQPKPELPVEVKAPVQQVVAPPQPTMTTPTVAGTDEEFPFDWYISLVEAKVINNWQPRQLGFGSRAIVSCSVHFRIARNGTVSQVSLVRNSGVGVYDRESLRAVQTTKLPPLPPQYKGSTLGITFIFNLEPGK